MFPRILRAIKEIRTNDGSMEQLQLKAVVVPFYSLQLGRALLGLDEETCNRLTESTE